VIVLAAFRFQTFDDEIILLWDNLH